MFRRTDAQATFGSLSVLLSPRKIAKLEKNHWAGSFRCKALPVLLANEQIFTDARCPVTITAGPTNRWPLRWA